jgi:prevent-host-death family protein
MKAKEKVMNASEFKAKCLKILENLPEQGVLILKHGKPVARVISVEEQKPLELHGALKGKIKIKGDILSTGTKWNAES